jgi:hypothetical protein
MMLQNGVKRDSLKEGGSFLQERSWFGFFLTPCFFILPVKPTTTTINLTGENHDKNRRNK